MPSSTKILLFFVILFLWEATSVTAKRSRIRDDDEVDDDSSASSSTETLPSSPVRIRNENFPDRPKRYDGLTINDPISSSQNISPAIAQGYNNPFLLNNQASLLGNQAGLLGNQAGLLGNQGGYLGNQGLYQNAGLGFGLQNPYLGGAGGLGGLGNYNPYANSALQSQLLLQQQGGGQGGLGGLYGQQDLYNQQTTQGGIYNQYNPLLGQNNFGLQGGLGGVGTGGINPYLLGRNGYLGQNYLAQSLLSPYTSYNQLNPYNTFPLSSRFGVGRASNRVNSQSSSSNSNNEE